MILAGNQPYFLPYIGYWQLINVADVFCILDDCNYIRHGWINRNRILNHNKERYFNIELNEASSNKLINEISLNDIDVRKKCNLLEVCYKEAPYFNQGMSLAETILNKKERNLALFLKESIEIMCEYLEINTDIILTSSIHQSKKLRGVERVYDLCNRLGADCCYNAIGGQALYSVEEFEKRGIQLRFLKADELTYQQFDGEGIANLSILDVLMFNSKETVQHMLQRYTIVGDTSKNEERCNGESRNRTSTGYDVGKILAGKIQ